MCFIYTRFSRGIIPNTIDVQQNYLSNTEGHEVFARRFVYCFSNIWFYRSRTFKRGNQLGVYRNDNHILPQFLNLNLRFLIITLLKLTTTAVSKPQGDLRDMPGLFQPISHISEPFSSRNIDIELRDNDR
ncbi:hypothetical protein EAE99_004349 [Botrytis elliptica]|nr:hypothetical protein EAE99_004349 [Botrytis elliptica]